MKLKKLGLSNIIVILLLVFAPLILLHISLNIEPIALSNLFFVGFMFLEILSIALIDEIIKNP